jgi:hypothetical protein
MANSLKSAGSSSSSASEGKKRTAHPAGIVRRKPGWLGLSFVSSLYDERGKPDGVAWFDVPAEEYCAGNRTGERVFFELLTRIQTGTRRRQRTAFAGTPLFEVMGAAYKALEDSADGVSRCGAAVGFLRAMEGLVIGMAPLVNLDDYKGQFAARHAAVDGIWAKERAAKREHFLRNMAAGKARKALEQQQ